MAGFKTNLSRLAELIVEDALKDGVPLDTRIQSLKAVTALHLGDTRIKAMLKAKGVEDEDDDEGAPVTNFRKIRQRLNGTDG